MLAFIAVVAPWSWLAAATNAALSQEPTAAPLTHYLIRAASAMYVLHGAVIFFVSFDVIRYRPLIRFLAWFALFHGGVMVAVDLHVGMPLWWTCLEGPLIAVTGLVLLWLLRRISSPA